ncbi:MAG: HDOD domain-containing protein [Spirochaetota bacterium]
MTQNTVPKLGIDTSSGKPLRVLIVDDTAIIRMMLKRILVRQNFYILGEASDGEDLLENLEKLHSLPDIICIDYHMPAMNGIEAAKAVREKYGQQIKIVMITNYSNIQLVQSALKLKLDGFILKPLEEDFVLEKMIGILGRKDLSHKELQGYKTKLIDLKSIEIPSIPEVMLKVANFNVEDPEKGSKELENLVSPDIGISSVIIRIANSSYYGRSGHVSSLKEAIRMLGVKMVKNIIILEQNKEINKRLKHSLLKKHLRKQPILASLIAFDIVSPLQQESLKENIFLMSLLRKIGMNILALNFKDNYINILRLYEFGVKSIFALEQEEFNSDSIDIGIRVFKFWKLPETFLSLVERQNFPVQEITEVSHEDRVTRISEILSKKMMELPILEAEEELLTALYDFYQTPDSVRQAFGEDYYELIKDHPFFELSMH